MYKHTLKNTKSTDIHQSVSAVLTSEEGSGQNGEGTFLFSSEYENSFFIFIFSFSYMSFTVIPVQHDTLSIYIYSLSFWRVHKNEVKNVKMAQILNNI